ncbi:unnamed protein product [Pedinophyceae sp. YPF-701]|nr:unnamed protein product [Pedinophyceae sp. YPF-701]
MDGAVHTEPPKTDGEPRPLLKERKLLVLSFGRTADEVWGGSVSPCGPAQDLLSSEPSTTAGSAAMFAHDRLAAPSVEDIATKVQNMKPSFIYVIGDVIPGYDGGRTATLGPMVRPDPNAPAQPSNAPPATVPPVHPPVHVDAQGDTEMLPAAADVVAAAPAQAPVAGAPGEAAAAPAPPPQAGVPCPVDASALVEALRGRCESVDCVYLDFQASDTVGEALHRDLGVPAVICMPTAPVPAAVPAALFSRVFFSLLRRPGTSVHEAFALAAAVAFAHCQRSPPSSERGGSISHYHVAPSLPIMFSAQPAALPSAGAVPPCLTGTPPADVRTAVPGWDSLQMLVPRGQLRITITGDLAFMTSHKLAALGEALRGLLVVEARGAVLRHASAPSKGLPLTNAARAPGPLLRCDVETASGAQCAVLLSGEPTALESREGCQQALRMALAADAQTLQFLIPPKGATTIHPRRTEAVAHGSSCIDLTVAGSVWALHALQQLAQDASYRLLAALGVAALGGAPTAAFSRADAMLFDLVRDFTKIPLKQPPQYLPGEAPLFAAGADPEPIAIPYLANGQRAPSAQTFPPLFEEFTPPPAAPVDGGVADAELDEAKHAALGGAKIPKVDGKYYWTAMGLPRRAPLERCSKPEFVQDLAAFIEVKRPGTINAATFPDTVLNGQKLDVWTMYREVVAYGGLRAGGNAINWKSRVWPRMHNYTENNKLTGVAKALKQHYKNFLLEYEDCHPEDLLAATHARDG